MGTMALGGSVETNSGPMWHEFFLKDPCGKTIILPHSVVQKVI
jgi:hypothetical protein